MLERIKKIFNNKKNEETEISVSEKIENLYDELNKDVITLDLGDDLFLLETLMSDVIHELREEIYNECGFIIPKVNINNNVLLQENEFVLYIRSKITENGFLIPNEKGIREEFYEVFKTIIYNKIEDIFTNSLAERYIDTANRKNYWLISNITRVLSIPEIKIILLDIINNGKSINDIGLVFEKIGENILLDGGYQDYFYKTFNPHQIAKQIVKVL